ncbi:MAG TPA: hypothetical protein VM677_33155 [Actinokineospora sp.]|nr:hypothetical protein [Actinokineospora sp.]
MRRDTENMRTQTQRPEDQRPETERFADERFADERPENQRLENERPETQQPERFQDQPADDSSADRFEDQPAGDRSFDEPATDPFAAQETNIADPGVDYAEPMDTDQHGGLLAAEDAARLRTEWQRVQSAFVDDPGESVRGADSLVNEALRTLEAAFADRRQALQQAGGQTEDMRQTLRQYRELFDHLLDA